LTTCGKIWGQRGRKEGAGGLDKEGPTPEWSATIGQRPPTAPRSAVADRSAVALSTTAGRLIAQRSRPWWAVSCRESLPYENTRFLAALSLERK
jgi:hypothetical protein